MDREFIEGNKSIAIYMGYEYVPSPVPFQHRESHENPFGWRRKIKWNPMYAKSMDDSDFPLKRYHLAKSHYDLKFHSHWEWLMPVLCKILKENEYHLLLSTGVASIYPNLKMDDFVAHDHSKSYLKNVWLVVSGYIDELNEKKKNRKRNKKK